MQRQNVQQVAEKATKNQHKTTKRYGNNVSGFGLLPRSCQGFKKNDFIKLRVWLQLIIFLLIDVSSILD